MQGRAIQQYDATQEIPVQRQPSEVSIPDTEKKTELKSQALIKVAFLITQSTFIFPIKIGGKTICKEVHFTPVKEENKLS